MIPLESFIIALVCLNLNWQIQELRKRSMSAMDCKSIKTPSGGNTTQETILTFAIQFLRSCHFSFSEGKSFVFINCGGICALSVCNLWETTRTDNLVLRKKRHIATMNILTVKNGKNEFELHCDSVLDFFRLVDIFRHLPKGCRGSVNNKA